MKAHYTWKLRAWKLRTLGACFALSLWQTPPAIAAETWYRWVDSRGTVHIDEQRPTGTNYDSFQVPDSIPWKGRPDLPAEVTATSKRSTQDLFRTLSESIYQVLGRPHAGLSKADPVVFGSAVAISERLLLTNCHVIEAAGPDLSIGLSGVDALFQAEIVAQDHMMDRCVVSVSDIRLHPIEGVRRYESLEIGETLYAIGNPARLERTLSDGLLSGKRVIDGRRYLQTTAAISPGSSGGGLFDASGNLVGITTMTLRGTQNINFAIPAEDFWK